jgi:hypothetical protein
MASPITPNITNRSQGCQNATGAEFFCEYVRTVLLTDPPSARTTTRAPRTCAAAA